MWIFKNIWKKKKKKKKNVQKKKWIYKSCESNIVVICVIKEKDVQRRRDGSGL